MKSKTGAIPVFKSAIHELLGYPSTDWASNIEQMKIIVEKSFSLFILI